MDTHAAVRLLQTHGLTLEQAEDITATIQDAVALHPTNPELRQFVLSIDLKFAQIQTDIGDMKTTLTQMQGTLSLHEHLLTGIEQRLQRLDGRARLETWAMGGLALMLGLLACALALLR